MSGEQLQTIVVEYVIQNETADAVKSDVGRFRGVNNAPDSPVYPTMFIMSKKYPSAKYVKVAEVIRAFPPQALGGQAPRMNPLLEGVRQGEIDPNSSRIRNQALYGNLHFRFESCLVNAKTGRKFTAYRDIVCPDGDLNKLSQIPVPLTAKGGIKVKVLRMPFKPAVQKSMAHVSTNQMRQIYRAELGIDNKNSNTRSATASAGSSSGGGLLENATGMFSNMAQGVVGSFGGSQQTRAVPQESSSLPSTEGMKDMASAGIDKMSSAAKELTEALGQGMSSLFSAKKKEQAQASPAKAKQQERNPYTPSMGAGNMGGDKLTFDDEDDEDAWKAEMELAKKVSLQQAQRENEERIQRLREQSRLEHEANIQKQTDLLFGEDPLPTTSASQAQGYQGFDALNDLGVGGAAQDMQFNRDVHTTNNIFGSDEPLQQPTAPAAPMNDLMGDLGGIDFSMPQQPQPEETQTNMFTDQKVPVSRSEFVKQQHQAEELKQAEWNEASNRLATRLDQWVGGPSSSNAPQMAMPGYMMPQKNSIKVLLATLHQVLWQGSPWGVIGMDKLAEPKQVKTCFRKAIMVVHPDRQPPDCDGDRRYISNRCFAALNEAFDEYKKEPGVNL